ncbi:MAG: S49 family peptidase, partial [Bacteroidota bacterium]
FLKRVSDGRGMPVEKVHEIAQGRVWIGDKAMELGLVDEMGGLEAAIEEAAELAGLSEYRTTEYPKIKDPITQLIEDLKEGNGIPMMQSSIDEKLKDELGSLYPYFQHVKSMQDRSGVQAIMPFVVRMD